MRRNRLLALAILAILALAAVAPAGQASEAGSERQAQRALIRAQHEAEHEATRLQREANRAARREARTHNQAERQVKAEQHTLKLAEGKFDEHAAVTITCTSITVEFHGFTPVAGSPQTISQKVLYHQSPAPTLSYVFAPAPFEFEGSGATEVIPIAAPLGASVVSIRAHFNKNGQRGAFNIREPLTCGPNSQFSLDTQQSIGGAFTHATLPGAVGEMVNYQVTAVNTGNTPLAFGALSTTGCDGPISGGSTTAVQPRGGSATWYCHHTLTAADRKAGAFANAASLAAVPEQDPFTPSVVRSTPGVLISPILGEVSTAAKPATGTAPKSGVLSFSSSKLPLLVGPLKCVRGMFSAGVKAAGVSNVTFYIDGHKLARRTAHSAVKGMIVVRINGAKLKAGVHRLLARISMSNAVKGSRTRTVKRCGAAPAHKH